MLNYNSTYLILIQSNNWWQKNQPIVPKCLWAGSVFQFNLFLKESRGGGAEVHCAG